MRNPSWAVICMMALLQSVNAAEDGLADPTRPPMAREPLAPVLQGPDPVWNLSMVKLSADRRCAVINQRYVCEGEEVDAATVVSVAPAEVVLEAGNSRIQLLMKGLSVKTRSVNSSMKLRSKEK